MPDFMARLKRIYGNRILKRPTGRDDCPASATAIERHTRTPVSWFRSMLWTPIPLRRIGDGATCRFPLCVTPLSELELENAIQLRVFRKQIAADDVAATPRSAPTWTLRSILIVKPMTEAMYTEARRPVSNYGARDSALGRSTSFRWPSAIVLEADSFHTFYNRQKKLVKAAGLVCH